MLLVLRLLILSFMLLEGFATHSAAASADSHQFLRMALAANSPISSYYTTNGQDPMVPLDGDSTTGNVPLPERNAPDEQRHQNSPVRSETTSAPGLILAPGSGLHDASAPEGWAPVRTTTTVLKLNHNPATYGDMITFTATVSPSSATGTVDFLLDGAPFGPPAAVLDGVATTPGIFDLPPGAHVVSADYGGDDTHGMSSSSLQKLSISKALQKIEFPPVPAVFPGGASPVLLATATSGLPVGYVSSNPAVAVITEDGITIVGAGSTLVTATQEGSDFFYPAPPVSRVFVVKAQP